MHHSTNQPFEVTMEKLDENVSSLHFQGTFGTEYLLDIKSYLQTIGSQFPPTIKHINLEMIDLEYADSNVFWIIRKWACEYPDIEFQVSHLPQQFQHIWDALPLTQENKPVKHARHPITQQFNHKMNMFLSYVSLSRDMFLYQALLNKKQKKLLWINFCANVQEMGLKGLPVFGLTMFFMGIVLTLQGAYQLSMFSAEFYVVDFLAVSVFREIGPILAGVLFASRTGSAITAQIGTMKINEEIQMLEVMGLNPTKLILLPKVLALLIISPLVTFYSCFMAMLGGLLIFTCYLKYSSTLFISLFSLSLTSSSLFMSAWKGPLFALFIGVIACAQGMSVKSNAIDVGKKTTAAVVSGLISILILDGMISVFTTFVLN